MLTLFITISIVEFFLSIFLLRNICYLLVFGVYCQCVIQYVLDKGITDNKEIQEYYKNWSYSQIMVRFWNWSLRDFMVNQDLFDEVVEYVAKKYKI